MKAAPSGIAYVLDDDPLFIRLMIAVLKKYGFACETFVSSPALLNRLNVRLPSLCILDLNVESINSSLELVKEIRKSHPPELPVLMTSTTADQAVIAHAIESGVNDYLLKPLEREVLVSKLMRHLKSPELESAALGFYEPPDFDLKVSLEMDARLLEVDELGVKILSQTLIAKGTVVSLSGDIFHTITGRSKPLLLTAASTWLENQENFYGAYLEYDETDAELSMNIRTWLVRQKKA